jgi:hypothetical protein
MMKSMLASSREPTSWNKDPNQSNQNNLSRFDFGESSNGGSYPAFMATRRARPEDKKLRTFIAMKRPKVF